MPQLSAWMGAGVVAAGVSAALIAGVDTASADTGSDTSGSASASTSDSADRGPEATGDSARESRKPNSSSRTETSGSAGGSGDTSEGDTDPADTPDESGADETADDTADDTGDVTAPDPSDLELDDTAGEPEADAGTVPDVGPEPSGVDEQPPLSPEPQHGAAVGTEAPAAPTTPATTPAAPAAVDTVAAQQVSATVAPTSALAAPAPRTFQDVIQSLVMEIIGAAVRFVSGPPVTPPGSNVTVRSSRLEITDGRTVRADWYYPDGDEPPQRLIYLQHGYLGIGPMYSYTASWLAERTNSIVVAPTLSSNRYVRDGFWLGDDQVYRATAELLLGDRDALTASAVKAGLVRKYGPDAVLPQSFTLVGHSLGAGVAAGAARYYADAVLAAGGTNHLAGIVLLDGAPPAGVLAGALDTLDGLGDYIPVFELGAPKESGVRPVDDALNDHRPGRFNGVVLDGGQHLDAMQGGSRLIQYVSYLYRGFPTEQNKDAAQTFLAGWVNDIFAGRIDPSTGACGGDGCDGIYGEPGQALSVDTPAGPATGVVIGTAVAPTRTVFSPVAADSVMFSRSKVVRLLIDG